MLSKTYVNKVRRELTSWHVKLFTSQVTNDALAVVSLHKFNRDVVIQLVAKDQCWLKLVNQQLIHAQRFTNHSYDLNLNSRGENALNERARSKLASVLIRRFRVSISETGQLVAKNGRGIKDAFQRLCRAIIYVQNYGDRYVVHHNSVSAIGVKLRHDLDAVKSAKRAYRRAINRVSPRQNQHRSKLPRAHGKVVAGFSSTAGTPRAIRHAKERRTRAKRRAFLSQHPEVVKRKRRAKQRRLAKRTFDLRNKKVVTSGRLRHSRAAYAKLMQRLHGHLQQGVNGQTNYLICNQPNRSRNYRLARLRQVKIIKESQIKNW